MSNALKDALTILFYHHLELKAVMYKTRPIELTPMLLKRPKQKKISLSATHIRAEITYIRILQQVNFPLGLQKNKNYNNVLEKRSLLLHNRNLLHTNEGKDIK